jgi:hypothetical protein
MVFVLVVEDTSNGLSRAAKTARSAGLQRLMLDPRLNQPDHGLRKGFKAHCSFLS